MANANNPVGLVPIRHRGGAPYSGGSNLYYHDSGDGTALYIGDPVKSGGSADANGVPSVIRAAAGDAIRGVVVGIKPATRDSTPYLAGSTAGYVYVADDPNLIFEVQEDSVGGALTITEVGENADVVAGNGSTVTGRSGFMLDSSDHKTTTAQLRILRIVLRPDNAVGTYAKWEVMINEHELASTSGI